MTSFAAPAGQGGTDLICFSHLRWDFVFQRPQHLLSRAAKAGRVFYVEEPVWGQVSRPELRTVRSPEGVVVVTFHLQDDFDLSSYHQTLKQLLDNLIAEQRIERPVLWYYTPHGLAFSDHLRGYPAVYDCMDELSAFKEADPALPELERGLLARADVVFTGGFSLYEAKRRQHANVHSIPSGVDADHFLPARDRALGDDPADQAAIPHPRFGYYGVLDERLDWGLLEAVADLRPHAQFIMLGPVAKLEPWELPRRPNIHYLGAKSYAALPAYARHWDVALMPFALNDATRFISPTKTPEYLAAGLPVVSTSIRDVVRHYCGLARVRVADSAAAFAGACDDALALGDENQAETDAVLAAMSWDAAWARMDAMVARARGKAPLPAPTVMLRAQYDAVVVGAGFAGSVLAERLAAGSGQRVLVVDRRPHIGGNAYDCLDAAGVLIHPYGPHIFHTNSEAVLDYLSRFTAWRPYEHRVLAEVAGMQLPMPINRTTINRFFGVDLAEAEVAGFLAQKAEPCATVRTSADVVLGTVGRALYEAFFQGYTRKQWGLDPAALDKSVTARVPTRTNDDDRYFTDRFQVMPRDGYTPMFQRMLAHPNITVALETEWLSAAGRGDHLVFTGPVDEFYGHRFGKLPYRSLGFRHETHPVPWKQAVGVVNYPAETVPFTRITEFKHLTGQAHPQTSLCYEFPSADGDPYYPVPKPENAALYQRYQALADAETGVTFAGRLATYRYYNMDQVVGQALAAYQRLSQAGRGVSLAAE